MWQLARHCGAEDADTRTGEREDVYSAGLVPRESQSSQLVTLSLEAIANIPSVCWLRLYRNYLIR